MRLFYFLFAFLFIVACSNLPKNAKPNTDAPNGKKIFMQFCAACHGSDGLLGANGALPLPQSKMNLEDRIHIISEGRKMMTPFKEMLTEEEIKAVAEFSLSFQ